MLRRYKYKFLYLSLLGLCFFRDLESGIFPNESMSFFITNAYSDLIQNNNLQKFLDARTEWRESGIFFLT